MPTPTSFAFPPDTIAFLSDLRQHNEKEWFDKPHLARYRAAVTDPTVGGDLIKMVAELEGGAWDVGGETYARTPRGYDADGDAERLLRHSALYVHAELPTALATTGELPATLVRHWTTFAPLHHWLISHVQGV